MASLRNHQKKDDTGAAGGPGGPGGPGMGGLNGFHEDSAATSQVEFMAQVGAWPSHGAHGGKAKDKEWLPVTKLCHLVKGKKIKSLEEI